MSALKIINIVTHLAMVFPLRLLQLVPELLCLRGQSGVEKPELFALLLRLLQLRLQLGLQLAGSLLIENRPNFPIVPCHTISLM